MAVEKGNRVKILYTGTLEDGTIFDSSENHNNEPLEFEVGSGMVIPGFDNAVLGMEKDEEKQVKIEPKDAYGEINPELIREFPKAQIPKPQKINSELGDSEEIDLEEGMILGMQTPDGNQIPVKITKVTEDKVTLDLNSPLAGKILNFKIKVVDYF